MPLHKGASIKDTCLASSFSSNMLNCTEVNPHLYYVPLNSCKNSLTVDDLVSSLWIHTYSCYLNAFSLSYALLPAMPHLCKISDLNSS